MNLDYYGSMSIEIKVIMKNSMLMILLSSSMSKIYFKINFAG